jgi:hypothetical protein
MRSPRPLTWAEICCGLRLCALRSALFAGSPEEARQPTTISHTSPPPKKEEGWNFIKALQTVATAQIQDHVCLPPRDRQRHRDKHDLGMKRDEGRHESAGGTGMAQHDEAGVEEEGVQGRLSQQSRILDSSHAESCVSWRFGATQ